MNSRMNAIDARTASVTWVAACLERSSNGLIHQPLQVLIPGEGPGA
ncbi:hypothetical protein [Aquabacterium sp.]